MKLTVDLCHVLGTKFTRQGIVLCRSVKALDVQIGQGSILVKRDGAVGFSVISQPPSALGGPQVMDRNGYGSTRSFGTGGERVLERNV